MRLFINTYVEFRFKPVFAVWIFFGFVLFTIVGTLSHEMGHIAFAKALGYQTTLHYGSMNYFEGPDRQELDSIWKTYETEIEEGMSYPEKERFKDLEQQIKNRNIWITAGGPFQTIFTGTLGLTLLYLRRKSI